MKKTYILFTRLEQITARTAHYFKWIQGEYHTEELPFKPTAKSPPEMRQQKVWDREPQPPTLSGLAYHLGFDSLHAFEAYEKNGCYASVLKRARLQIETEYEKQLHSQPATGAIFALKSLGWLDKPSSGNSSDVSANSITIKIEVLDCAHVPATSEQQVAM